MTPAPWVWLPWDSTTQDWVLSNGLDQGPGRDGAELAELVSLEAEIPEVLFNGMREFIQCHPHWDQYRLVSSALASFLFQNGCTDRNVTQHYLNGLFLRRDQG